MHSISPYEELADYRRAVAEMYAQVRQPTTRSEFERTEGQGNLGPEARWLKFRRARDVLLASHPQSALTLAQRATFTGLPYYPYDPHLRFALPVDTNVDPVVLEVELPEDGLFRMKRFGRIRFNVASQPTVLSLFWVLGYGGGIFLPFRDPTNGTDTYGGGRYLLDTIKHADLGREGDFLVVDFNYAYSPSCAYDSRWHCPLAPAENWLQVPVRAGEMLFPA